MTNLKEKLSASVRLAKATSQSAVKTATPSAVSKPVAAKPVAAKPVAAKPVAKKTPVISPDGAQPAPPKAVALGGIAFPDRVWPD